MNLLVSVAEGLGNVLQCLPLIWSLKKSGHNISIWLQCNFPHVDRILELLTDCPVSLMGNPLPYPEKWYDGRVETIWSATNPGRLNAIEKLNIPIINNLFKQGFETKSYQLKGFNKIKYLKTEVQVALEIFRELEPDKKIIYTLEEYFENKNIKQKIVDKCVVMMSKNEYHLFTLNNFFEKVQLILIHNGYNFNSKSLWQRKSYDHFPEVINELQQIGKIQIGSIGHAKEYIKGTKDFTEVSIYCLIALILKSRLFVSTDTGTYHLAAALGVPGITIFTFTNLDKNYDSNFHYNIMTFQSTISCCPCQSTNYRDKCTEFKCKNIQYEVISNMISEKLKKLPVMEM